MRRTLDIRPFFFIFILLAVCATATWIVNSAHFMKNPNGLAFALTADLTLVLPAFFYIFIVRRKRLPVITLVPVFILFIVIASFILPVTQQLYLDLVKKIIPVVEFVALGFIVIKIRTIVRHYRENKTSEIYFTDALLASFQRVLGVSAATNILVNEMLMLYYAIGGWFKKFTRHDADNALFSYHRKAGYTAMLIAILLVLVVETTALHLLLQRWSALTAWVVTGFSLYGLFWLVGDYHAIRLHPIVLGKTHLHLRTGMRWRAMISLADIAEIHSAKCCEKKAGDYVSIALFGTPRLMIDLKQPIKVTGFWGVQKEAQCVAFTVDDEKRFRDELNKRLNRFAPTA